MTIECPARRDILAATLALTVSSIAAAAAAPRKPQAQGGYAFCYFQNADNGGAGMRLAISHDGLRFAPIRGGAPLLVPEVGEQRLMRDPCIAYDAQRRLYHMVWTTGWTGVTIGYATSPDLLRWSPQRAIPVMADHPGTRNCWAPELVFDAARREWTIFWSSTIDGAFPETAGADGGARNHRIYATTTRDFRRFTPARLFYEPGFNVIDATFLRDRGKLYLFVKDETKVPLRKHIRVCEAQSVWGPFGPLSPPLTPSMTEGPTAYRRGDEIVMLFDRYVDKAWGALATRDMRTWRDISTEIALPAGANHGTVLPIGHATMRRLEAAA